MNIGVITYATDSHKPLAKRLENCVRFLGLEFTVYDDHWLKTTSYYAENKNILDEPRGAGYWAWKPWIILDALKKYDKVLYLDSSVHFDNYQEVHAFIRLYNFATPNVTYPNKIWTKRDCFRVMNCDEEKYWNAGQVWAGVVLACRGYEDVLEYWLDYCKNRKAITDDPSEDNFPEFVDHRHDQSILTNMVVKFGLSSPYLNFFFDN